MSISNVAIAQTPPYPSFDELRTAPIAAFGRDPNHPVMMLPLDEYHRGIAESTLKSSAMSRIFWTLDGPFPAAISVMEDRHSPSSLTPYFSDGTWHPISKESISNTKVSSITVHVEAIGLWEGLWLKAHREHVDTGIPGQGRWYGELEDCNSADDDYDFEEQNLLGCCGEPRPSNGNDTLVVIASSEGFVTIHDYLSTLHPWLMALKGDIVSSNALSGIDLSEMVVSTAWPYYLSVKEKADWIRRTSSLPNPAPQAPRQPRELPEWWPVDV